MQPAANPLLSHPVQSATLIALEEAARLTARLDGRIAGSSVRRAWRIRAAWSGYAEAMRLQGSEVDEIDIFSWGCDVPLPHRPRRASHLDEMSAFAPWLERLDRSPGGAWRDALPFTPVIAPDLPPLLRAFDIVRQYARRSGNAAPWLLLPVALRQMGATETVLPCLVAGVKAFRDPRGPGQETLRAALRSLAAKARLGLDLLDGLERDHRHATTMLLAERRPGALTPLMGLAMTRPLLSPVSVADALGLSLSGAGKLLDRAAGLGLLCEISGRLSWRSYLAPDIAILFGFAPARKGRPRIEQPVEAASPDLAALLATFDRDMAAFDARFGTSGTPAESD